jgi:hypothetical protein
MYLLLYWRISESLKPQCYYYEQEVVVSRLPFSERNRSCDVGLVRRRRELRCCFIRKKGKLWCCCLEEVGVAKLLGKEQEDENKGLFESSVKNFKNSRTVPLYL